MSKSWSYLVQVTTHTGGVDWNQPLFSLYVAVVRHHPHGWCGLKWFSICNNETKELGHHPHGWCGLKLLVFKLVQGQKCHHPHGWCGLKSQIPKLAKGGLVVTTHTGGVDWNNRVQRRNYRLRRSPPTRVVWIEIKSPSQRRLTTHCHHPHGWCGLKYICNLKPLQVCKVTTHTGGVDWNK